MGRDAFRGALEAVDRVLNREPEADEVLRQTVAILHDRIEPYTRVTLSFVEEGKLVTGPAAGTEGLGARRLEVPIRYGGKRIAALEIETAAQGEPTEEERAFLERVALLISGHCLVGWDTGGVPWPDVR